MGIDVHTLAAAKKYTNSVALGQGAAPIPGPSGKDGRQIELSENAGYIAWRYVGDTDWINIAAIESGGAEEKLLSALKGFMFEQETPSDLWTIPHNLDFRYVSVNVINDSGKTVIPDIKYTNNNIVALAFANPVSGTALIRR